MIIEGRTLTQSFVHSMRYSDTKCHLSVMCRANMHVIRAQQRSIEPVLQPSGKIQQSAPLAGKKNTIFTYVFFF